MNFLIKNWGFLRHSVALDLKKPTGDYLFRLFRYFTIEWDSKEKYKIAFDQCKLNQDSTLLEIGFGQGVGLRMARKLMFPELFRFTLKKNLNRGKIIGIDISEYAVRRAKIQNISLIVKGYVDIHKISVDHIPLLNHSVDYVIHIDSFYFWADLDEALSEIWEKLKPEGKIITVFNPKQIADARNIKLLVYSRPDFLAYTVSLERNGFNNVTWNRFGNIECITAEKPSILRIASQEDGELDK